LVCGPGPGFSRPAQALRVYGGGDHRIRTWEERGKTYYLAGQRGWLKPFTFKDYLLGSMSLAPYDIGGQNRRKAQFL
jgi:hypothetical protein